MHGSIKKSDHRATINVNLLPLLTVCHQSAFFLVPKLCVGTFADAPPPVCIPTQSVGTR